MPTPTLTLRQLDAPKPGQPPKTLELWQSAAPVDNIKWGVAQRHSIKHYPGSGEAAVFLDGPEEKPIELQFEWKSRRMDISDALLDSTSIANADELVEVVEGMVRDQTLVELTWRGRAVVGFLSEFIPVEGWESEYTATLTFTPTKSPRFETREVAPETPPASLYEGMFGAWQADTEAAVPPVSAPRRVLETVESKIDTINQTFRRFGSIASEVEQVGATTVQVYRGVGEVLVTLVNVSADLRDAVEQPAAALAQTDDPLAQMRAAAYQRDLESGARKTRHRAARERLYYRSLERRDLIGVHVVAAGETLWGIAWKWYGTTEAWRLIATRNALATTSPPAGTKLYIPRREAA